MLFLSIVHHYLTWHYTRALMEIFHVWQNFLWFTFNFFSIPQLLISWFAPWKRMTETRNGQWNFEAIAGFIIVNLLSRLIGFILRSIIILLGLSALLLLVIAGFATYVFWVAAPFILIGMLGYGITLLII
jgi:hypothetical protein